MANVIIGIHGLGNKPPKALLEKWWTLSMTEGLKSNNYNPVLSEFKLVYWADIVHDKPLDQSEKNKESPLYLDEKYLPSSELGVRENHNTRKKVIDFLGHQLNRIFLNDDLSLNYSFITDAIVKKYFKDLEIYYAENCTEKDSEICKAKDLIRKRLLTILEEHKNDNIMLIGHSMGSIIAFDVLTFIAPHIRINTFITMGSPLGLPIVISKIASEQKQKLSDINSMITPPNILNAWKNYSDILDKVAFDYKLSENFSENTSGIRPADFLVVNNYKMNGIPNPHKSYGYLRTPEFSKILNEFIQSERISIGKRVMRKTSQIIRNVKNKISTHRDKIKIRRPSQKQ
jgi:pimeloyl-ACP methyl ester carboxylesterase